MVSVGKAQQSQSAINLPKAKSPTRYKDRLLEQTMSRKLK
jgi:hypothetical protein